MNIPPIPKAEVIYGEYIGCHYSCIICVYENGYIIDSIKVSNLPEIKPRSGIYESMESAKEEVNNIVYGIMKK